jgi:hypothetical protein
LTSAQAKLDQAVDSGQPQLATSPTLARERAAAAIARAHARLLTALDGRRTQGEQEASELVDDAVALVRVVVRLWLIHSPSGDEDRLPAIAAALERRLSAHEHGVRSGELTYSLSLAQAERPAVRMRQSLVELGARDCGGLGDLISVQTAAIELAALLVRAAGNISTHACASEAPEERTVAVDRLLRQVDHKIATLARARITGLGEDSDMVGHHLASALRVPPPAIRHSGPDDRDGLAAAREAWLQIASLEHIAAAVLDAQLPSPAYRRHFQTLSAAIIETAANVISGARLLARPQAFRHDQAWRMQGTALSYALEMYINGQAGAANGLQQAQAIVLTRLVRATVAITLIDLQGAVAAAGDGHLSKAV